jgi:uncharacterized protein (TIGR02246 family)
MRRVLLPIVIAILASGVVIAKPTNEEQIRSRGEEFAAAWNKHDTVAMAMIWSVDGEVVNPYGRRAKGLTEIQKIFQDEHNTFLKQSTYKITSHSVRFVEPNIALVDFDVEISGVLNPDGTTTTIKPHVVSLWRKSGGNWWVVTGRAVSYLPPPAAPPK